MSHAALRTPSLHLPPVFRSVAAPTDAAAFAYAVAISGEAGAGTFVVGGEGDLLEAAIVLEPDEPLASSRRAGPLALDALRATLAAEAPPGTRVAVVWPDTVRVGGAVVGGIRLAARPSPCLPEAVPERLVLGITVRVAASDGSQPGAWARGTALAEEGFDDLDRDAFVEVLAAQILSRVDRWETEGFDAIGTVVAARFAGAAIGPGGDLLDGTGCIVAPAPAVGALPDWLDPETGAPWL